MLAGGSAALAAVTAVVAVGMLVGVFVGMLVGMTVVVTTGNVIVMNMHMGISFGHFFFIIIAAGFGVKTFIFPRIRGAGLLSPGKWDIMR
jgi:heme A synthase